VDYDKATFDIPQVAPGSYVLYAMEKDLVAQAWIEVGGSDVDNLVLTLRPGITISGTVVPPMPNVEVRLSPGPPVPDKPRYTGSTLSDGTFSISGLTPGEYTVVVSAPAGSYVKSITSGDTNALLSRVRVGVQSNPPIQVFMDLHPGRIEGRAFNLQGEPAADVAVILTPDANGPHRADLHRTVRTDVSGLYRIDDLAPGNYKLFAWEDAEPVAWHDADYLRVYETQGKQVRITEGSTHRIDTVVITVR
jgi:hypothetical protein